MKQMELPLPVPVLKQVNELFARLNSKTFCETLVDNATKAVVGYEVALLLGPHDYAEFKHTLANRFPTTPQEITSYCGVRIVQTVYNEPIRISVAFANI